MSKVVKSLLLSIISFSLYAQAQIPVQAQALQETWDNLKSQPQALKNALQLMPKGADLHCHASGATSTENLIHIAESNDYCIDENLAIHETRHSGQCQIGLPTKAFFSQPAHRKAALRAWSMADFKESAKEDGKAHFFNTFGKFTPLVHRHWPEIIADVRHQAALENIQYLELMLDMNGTKPQAEKEYAFDDMKTLVTRSDIQAFMTHNRQFFSQLKTKVDAISTKESKQVGLAWILEIKRNQVFAQFALDAYEVFSIASQVPDIVAINMVEAEYGQYANPDYERQMQWLSRLHQEFPNVHIVLHAGEVPKTVALSHTKGNIAEALKYASPLRIGHGLTILLEPEFKQSLNTMKEKKIAVEINLTSNDEILGVKGQEHPVQAYLKHEVPIVLSSDDPGVSRNHLSDEYFRAVYEQHFSLQQILQVNRNSLTYNLLPGASIWKNADKLEFVPECQNFYSKLCQVYITNNPKAKQQWLLEKNLLQFFSSIHA